MEADPVVVRSVARGSGGPPAVAVPAAAPPAVARAVAPSVSQSVAAANPRLRARLLAGGTDGNELLTSASGGVLIVLLAVIGLTIIQMRPLLSVHLFVGMVLIGPVALKMASTGYRFVRYYTANAAYRGKGAPPAPLRAIAPIVVSSTIVVFVSGVALLFAGPSSREALLPLHKVSFIVWLVFTAIHVIAHLPKMAADLRVDFRSLAGLGGHSSARAGRDHRLAALPGYSPGRTGRMLSLAGALVAGLVLAIVVIPQFGPWLAHPHGLHPH
jgi:hypothetical protein